MEILPCQGNTGKGSALLMSVPNITSCMRVVVAIVTVGSRKWELSALNTEWLFFFSISLTKSCQFRATHVQFNLCVCVDMKSHFIKAVIRDTTWKHKIMGGKKAFLLLLACYIGPILQHTKLLKAKWVARALLRWNGTKIHTITSKCHHGYKVILNQFRGLTWTLFAVCFLTFRWRYVLHIGPLNCIKLSIKRHIVFFANKSVAGQGRSLSLEYLHNWIFFFTFIVSSDPAKTAWSKKSDIVWPRHKVRLR